MRIPGKTYEYNAGVPMDTLQDLRRLERYQDPREKMASLGAGRQYRNIRIRHRQRRAYRGNPDDRNEDDEDYYDLQLDEGATPMRSRRTLTIQNARV